MHSDKYSTAWGRISLNGYALKCQCIDHGASHVDSYVVSTQHNFLSSSKENEWDQACAFVCCNQGLFMWGEPWK